MEQKNFNNGEDQMVIDEAISKIEQSSNHMVLEKLLKKDSYKSYEGKKFHGLFVDVETTGLNVDEDKVIQFGAIPFTFSEEMKICEVYDPVVQYEDPLIPIPQEVTWVTGITQEMVKGKKIDDQEIKDLMDPACLIVAHNASFDRPIIEYRFEGFNKKVWGCSFRDIPWLEITNVSSQSLEFLLFKVCGKFFDAHDAGQDCLAGIELLAHKFQDGSTALSYLVKKIQDKEIRVKAINSPFDLKDRLKARKYRWCPMDERSLKYWFKDIPNSEKENELEWLEENVYKPGARSIQNVSISIINPVDRYSARV